MWVEVIDFEFLVEMRLGWGFLGIDYKIKKKIVDELLKISCLMFNFGKEKIWWILLAPLEQLSYRSLRGSILKNFFFNFSIPLHLETLKKGIKYL